jgi:branched-chain amino acid transport system substrate-binding protein
MIKMLLGKKFFWIGIIFSSLIMMVFGASQLFWKTDPIYIAVVGPMKTANGEAMVQGVQLYLDKINAEGGINGRPVEKLLFDDEDDKNLVVQQAKAIVASKALAVIGHYSSDASLAAAPIYQANGIPAITGSATANEITENTDWYFRVTFNNSDQGAILANYAHKVLGYKQAFVFYDEDNYGRPLQETFSKTATKIGLNIKQKWHFNSQNFQSRLNEMIESLQQDNDGILFLAIHSREAVDTIKELRRVPEKVAVMGSDALSSSLFGKTFQEKFPLERVYPGYYTDGIYTTSAFIMDIAGKPAQEFRREFSDRSYKPGSLITTAMYYDATMVTIDALKKMVQPQLRSDLAYQRQVVQSHLKKLSKLEVALEGVSGYLYFDKNGDAVKSIPVGIYEKGRITAAWYQYQPLTHLQGIDNLLQKVLDNEIIQVNEKFMQQTQVIYVGFDLNNVTELNIKDSTYTADFYLWFRFKESPLEGKQICDPKDFHNPQLEYSHDNKQENCIHPVESINFINLFTPANESQPNLLEKPMLVTHSKMEPGVTIKTYRLKTQLRMNFDFRDYPLDKQVLPFQLRHNQLTTNRLIFVVDRKGMSMDKYSINQKNDNNPNQSILAIGSWRINKISFFLSSLTNDSTLGIPALFDTRQRLEYSVFNVEIEVARKVLNFVLKTMLPIIFVIGLGYAIYFTGEFGPKITLNINLIISTSLFHLRLASSLAYVEYNVLIEYVFYVIYMMATFGIIASLLFQAKTKKLDALTNTLKELKTTTDPNPEEMIKLQQQIAKAQLFTEIIQWTGRIGYPLMLIVSFIVIFYDHL